MIRILLIAALLPALPAHAQQATTAKPTLQLAKPASGVESPGSTGATHHWYDNGRRRGLLVDDSLRADFSSGKAVLADTRTPAGKALDAIPGADAPGSSPVFRDAASPAVKRALPGGAIITTHAPTDAESLGRLLATRGLAVSRQLDADGTRWLVETPSGITGLELANQLHESGDFAAVAPNWWRERALK